MILLCAWLYDDVRQAFEHDPAGAIPLINEKLEKLNPDRMIPNSNEVNVLKIPPRPANVEGLFDIAVGNQVAAATPYTCCIC
jgi:hypothetical protein